MESFLQDILADYQVVRINHIGSTTIEGIWAKDIVDVLLEYHRQGVATSIFKYLLANILKDN